MVPIFWGGMDRLLYSLVLQAFSPMGFFSIQKNEFAGIWFLGKNPSVEGRNLDFGRHNLNSRGGNFNLALQLHWNCQNIEFTFEISRKFLDFRKSHDKS